MSDNFNAPAGSTARAIVTAQLTRIVHDERPSKAEQALRELADEFGLAELTDPDSIRRRILFRDADRDSRTHQLEAKIDVLEHHRIPHLEAQLHDARIDGSAWENRAQLAESREGRLLWAYIALVALGVIGCLVVAYLGTR